MSTLTAPQAAAGPLPAGRRSSMALVTLATSLPMFVATLDNLVVTTALPVLRADLGADVGQLSWVVNAYTLCFAILMLPAAALGDRIGRRRVMLGGLTLFAAASVAAALSGTPESLVAARAVQGVGAAAVVPLSLSLLAAAVPPARRAAAIGIWGGVSGLGVALGPVVGGAVVEGLSWQAIFWLNVPVAAVAWPLARLVVPESRASRTRVDAVGTVLVGGSVLAAVWGVVRGNDDGWERWSVLGSLVVALGLLTGYVVWARRRPDAVLPLRLFRSRAFSAATVVALFFTLGMFGAVFLLSQYLQIVQGFSPLAAGVRTLPWTAAPMVVAPVAGLLAPRTGVRPLLVTGLLLQTMSLVWFASLTESAAPYSGFVVPLALGGIGMGLTFAPMSTAVLDGLPDRDLALASSANATVREFGIALGVAVLSAVFVGGGGSLTPSGYDDAIGPALLTGAAAVAVALLASLWVPGARRAQSEPPAAGDPQHGARP